MKEDLLAQAQKKVTDVNVLINVVSRRCKQLRYDGMKPLVESLEKLESEDIALREIIQGKVSYHLHEKEQELLN